MTEKRFLKSALLVLLCVGVQGGCSSGMSTRAPHVSNHSAVKPDGRWDAVDSRLVAREMVEDLLAQRWLDRFRRDHDRLPKLAVTGVRNLSHENLDTLTLAEAIQGALQHAAGVVLVERNAAGDSSADFLLSGTINTVLDSREPAARFYQLDLALIEGKTDRKVWARQKTVKKSFAR